MDDPLIGLTIFDSRLKPSSSGPGRPLSINATANGSAKKTTRREDSVDSNKLREKEGNKSHRGVDNDKRTDSKKGSAKESGKKSGTGSMKVNSKSRDGKKIHSGAKGKPTKGSDISGDLDKCFPCLPGLEDPQEREEENEASALSSSSGSEGSTPTSPLPQNDIDTGGVNSQDVDASPLTPAQVVDSNILMNSPVPQPQNFWLMRLFQSKLFDMSIAIGYLFNSKDSDVQAYLGNKLFVSTIHLHVLSFC